MTDANLGFTVDSSQLVVGEVNLDKFGATAERAQSSLNKFEAAAKRAFTFPGAVAFENAIKNIERSVGTLEVSANRINQALNIRTDFGAAERVRDIQAYGKALDDVRSKYNPVFAAIRQYKTYLDDVRTAQKQGAISMDEMTAAIQRQRRATLENIQQLKGMTPNKPDGTNPGLQQLQTANIAYQIQDIGVTAAMGMSPWMIALQQGPQISSALDTSQGIKGAFGQVAAGIASVVSPTSLATIALVGAGAAALQFGGKLFDSIETADKAMKNHEKTMEKIRKLYTDAGEAGSKFGQSTQGQIEFLSNRDRFLLQNTQKTQLTSLRDAMSPRSGSNELGINQMDILMGGQVNDPAYGLALAGLKARYGEFTNAVLDYIKAAQEGQPDVLAFNDEVIRIANLDPDNAGLQKLARSILDMTGDATKSAEALRDLNKELAETTRMMSRTDAANAQRDYAAQNAGNRFYMTRAYDAEIAGIGARSPAEIAAATSRRLEAEEIDPGREDQQTRELRINQQTELAYRQANQAILDAQRDRALSMEQIIKDQQNEIDLIGKTGGAAEALRFEYEQTAQVRLEAARQGIEVDEKEIQLIKERAKQLGDLVDLYNKARFNRETSLQENDANLNSWDRSVTQTLRGYGLSEDLSSPEAARLYQQIYREEVRGVVGSFITTFNSEMVNNGGKIGKAFGTAFLSGVMNIATKIQEKLAESITNQLVNYIMPQGSSGGGLMGLLGLGGTAAKTAANDNSITGTAPVIKVDRAVLPDIGASLSGSMATYASGIKKMESGSFAGNYSAIGPLTASGDRAYGAYQVMGNNIGPWTKSALGYSMTKDQFLASSSAQDAVFNHQFGGYVDKYGASNAAQAWFGGPGSIGKTGRTDVLGTSVGGYSAQFEENVQKLGGAAGQAAGGVGNLASSTGVAAEGLNGLGGGLSAFGKMLASAQAGGGGSGLLGALTSLTSVGQGLFNGSGMLQNAFSNGWYGVSAGGLGLYDSGGYTGPGGKNEVAGFVHKGEVVWSQADVSRAGGVGVVDRMRRGAFWGGYADGGIGLTGSSGPAMRATSGAALGSRRNAANDSSRGIMDVRISFDESGNPHTKLRRIAKEESEATFSSGIADYDYQLPDRVNYIDRHPSHRGN